MTFLWATGMTFFFDDTIYSYFADCPKCSGFGYNPENENEECPWCEGDGYLYIEELRRLCKNSLLGDFDDVMCPKCKGDCYISSGSDEECSLCEGNGYVILGEALDWIKEHVKNAVSNSSIWRSKMSEIKTFRVNGWDNISDGELDFYFKIEDGNENVMFNLCIGGYGIRYYPVQARILTPQENANTRSNYKMISMDNLGKLFDALQGCEWFGNGEDIDFNIKVRKNEVKISN